MTKNAEKAHRGCRVCNRADISLTKNGAVNRHVRPDAKGSSFLMKGGGFCSGAGHPPKGVIGRDAQAIVDALTPHFPDLKDPIVAEVIGEALQRQITEPSDAFEAILDMPNANWRLKRAWRDGPRQVRMTCYVLDPTEKHWERERQLNALLASL